MIYYSKKDYIFNQLHKTWVNHSKRKNLGDDSCAFFNLSKHFRSEECLDTNMTWAITLSFEGMVVFFTCLWSFHHYCLVIKSKNKHLQIIIKMKDDSSILW